MSFVLNKSVKLYLYVLCVLYLRFKEYVYKVE